MNDRPEALIYSDLSGSYLYEGREFAILIYRLPDSDWVVEIDSDLQSFVLEEFYSSEESAYAAALQSIHGGALDTGDSK